MIELVMGLVNIILAILVYAGIVIFVPKFFKNNK